MPITLFELLDTDGWEPLHVDQADANFYWEDGGFMTTAPVDVTATFEGKIWRAPSPEAAFGMRSRRLEAGFTVPTRHHNLDQLIIVVGGEMTVKYGDDGAQSQLVRVGEFWTSESKTPYSMTAGPEGVVYIECWTDTMSLVETYWHDDSNWVRR